MDCSDLGSSSESDNSVENSTQESTQHSTQDPRPVFSVVRELVVESIIEENGFDDILTPDNETSESIQTSAVKENNRALLQYGKVLARVTKKLKTNAFAPRQIQAESLSSGDFLSSNHVSSTQK